MNTENLWPAGYVAPEVFYCAPAQKILTLFEASEDEFRGRAFIRDRAQFEYRELGISSQKTSHESVVVSTSSPHAAVLVRTPETANEDDKYRVVILELSEEKVASQIEVDELLTHFGEGTQPVGFSRLLAINANSFTGIIALETGTDDGTSFETRPYVVEISFDGMHVRKLAELSAWEF